jgi:hypothetical protein
MVKLYKVKGEGYAIETAMALREKLTTRTMSFLQSALVVMVEEYPEEIPPNTNDGWGYLVNYAVSKVYTKIESGYWMCLPIELAVLFLPVNQTYIYLNGGDDAFLCAELDEIMDESPLIEPTTDLHSSSLLDDISLNDWQLWRSSILVKHHLAEHLAKYGEEMKNHGPSFVKSGLYRQHRKTIKLLEDVHV